MSAPIEAHYESLLASRYTWMMGGRERCDAIARELLDLAQITAADNRGCALDLGRGPGYHAKALAEQGLRVIAVDISSSCLLERRAGRRIIALKRAAAPSPGE